MKKKIVAAALCIVMAAGMLPACGKGDAGPAQDGTQGADESTEAEKTAPADITALSEADPSEYISLPDIASLKVTVREKEEVTDERVEEEYKNYLNSASVLKDVEDRDTVERGDVVTIDYSEENDAGSGISGEGYTLEVGTGTFSDEVDEGLIGMKRDETKTISFTYPGDYYDESLRGAASEFTVTVRNIQYYYKPEISDQTVAEFDLYMKDGTKVDSQEKLREYIREVLETESEESYRYNNESEAIITVVNASEVIKDYPEEMVASVKAFLLSSIGIGEEELDEETRESFGEYARDYIKEQLVIEKIASDNGITVTADDVEEMMKDLYGDDISDMLTGISEADRYTYTMMVKRSFVADWILENAQVETAPAGGTDDAVVSMVGDEE